MNTKGIPSRAVSDTHAYKSYLISLSSSLSTIVVVYSFRLLLSSIVPVVVVIVVMVSFTAIVLL